MSKFGFLSFLYACTEMFELFVTFYVMWTKEFCGPSWDEVLPCYHNLVKHCGVLMRLFVSSLSLRELPVLIGLQLPNSLHRSFIFRGI